MGELLQVPFAAPAGPRSLKSGSRARRRRQRRDQRPRGHNPAVEQERLWRLVWSRCPGIGWQRLERIEGMFGSLELAWQAKESDLCQATLKTEPQATLKCEPPPARNGLEVSS